MDTSETGLADHSWRQSPKRSAGARAYTASMESGGAVEGRMPEKAAEAPVDAPRRPRGRKRRRARRFVREFYWKAYEDNLTGLSGMVAYNLLLSVFPLALLALFIAGRVLASNAIETSILDDLRQLFPSAADSTLTTALDRVRDSSTQLGIVALVASIWIGSSFWGAMDTAFCRIYHVDCRSWLQQKRFSVVMLVVVLLFMAATVAVPVMQSILVKGASGLPFGLSQVEELLIGLTLAAGLLILFGVLCVIYWAVPNRRVPWRAVWPGALAATLTIGLIDYAFPFYLTTISTIARFGTTFVFVVIVLLWFYALAAILLGGATINAMRFEAHDDESSDEVLPPPERVSATGRETVLFVTNTICIVRRAESLVRQDKRTGEPLGRSRGRGRIRSSPALVAQLFQREPVSSPRRHQKENSERLSSAYSCAPGRPRGSALRARACRGAERRRGDSRSSRRRGRRGLGPHGERQALGLARQVRHALGARPRRRWRAAPRAARARRCLALDRHPAGGSGRQLQDALDPGRARTLRRARRPHRRVCIERPAGAHLLGPRAARLPPAARDVVRARLLRGQTACGQTLTKETKGVAHRTLPCGTKVALSYGGRELVAEVIDRGPFANDADYDLTQATTREIGMTGTSRIGALPLRDR